MDKDTSQLQLYLHFLGFFLPEGILNFFEPVWMETQSLDSRESKKDILYSSSLHIYLDERDNRTEGMQELRPNGFTEEAVITDFPVRDRKVVLHVRRRRCALTQTPDKWSENMKARMKLLFELYPRLKEACDVVNKLRAIFRSSSLTKETAKEKFQEWYKLINHCTLREVKSARNAVKSREDEVLNYFLEHSTNATAESFNSKIKAFRAQLRGVSDLPFFMFRLCKLFG